MPPPTIDKREVLDSLRAQLERDYVALVESQRATQRGATHEEARPENDKDTRALEATYLARGLADRVATLDNARQVLGLLALRVFSADDPVALGALVGLEDDAGALQHYFVVPEGGGVRVQVAGAEVTCVTPRAPLGQALVGKYLDDDVELDTPQGRRAFSLVTLR